MNSINITYPFSHKTLHNIRTELAYLYNITGQWEKAINELIIAKEEAEQNHRIDDLLNANNKLIWYKISRGELDSALELEKEILEEARTNNKINLQGMILLQIGSAYFSKSKYNKAIKHYKKALNIAKQVHSSRGEQACLGNMGVSYRHLGKFDKALECFQEVLKLAIESENLESEGTAFINIAEVYLEQDNLPLALKYTRKSLTNANKVI